jgi:hypothetical protein
VSLSIVEAAEIAARHVNTERGLGHKSDSGAKSIDTTDGFRSAHQ